MHKEGLTIVICDCDPGPVVADCNPGEITGDHQKVTKENLRVFI